jgi:hypothetical protein
MCYLCVRRLLSFSTLTKCINIAILLHYRYAYLYDKLQWKTVNDLASIHVHCYQHSRYIGILLRGRVLSVTQSHNTPMEAQAGERVYSSYLFTSSVLDGGEWSASRPGRALPPRKGPPRVLIVQEAGWDSELVWTQWLEEKFVASAGIEPGSPGRPVRSQRVLSALSIIYLEYTP